MDEKKWGLYGLIFGIIEFNLNFILYAYFKSEIMITWVILISLAIIIILVLLDNINKIENNTRKVNELTEKLKRTEELNDIRLNIREL